MKIIALLFAAALALYAQPPHVTITDTVYDGSATTGVAGKVTGSCTYRLTSGRAVTTGGLQVVGEPVTVRITNGAFSASIVPTDILLPASPTPQTYSVTCDGLRGWHMVGSWIVPSSGTTWNNIWAPTPTASSPLFLPAQINAVGKTTGTYCLDVVNGVITGITACTGGGGTLSLSSLTNSTLLSLTNSQLLSLTN